MASQLAPHAVPLGQLPSPFDSCQSQNCRWLHAYVIFLLLAQGEGTILIPGLSPIMRGQASPQTYTIVMRFTTLWLFHKHESNPLGLCPRIGLPDSRLGNNRAVN